MRASRRRGGDLHPQFGGAGKARGLRPLRRKKAEAPAPTGRKQQAARSGKIVKAGGDEGLRDDRRAGGAFQRLLHGPERLLRTARAHEGEARQIEPGAGEAAAIGQAEFPRAQILDDEDDRPAAPRHTGAQRHGQRKGRRRRGVRRAGGKDFAQRPGVK